MIDTLFFLPVAAKDVDRAVHTVRSIRKYCDDYRIHLLLDGPDPSLLPEELTGRDDIRVRSTIPPSKGHWGKIWLAQIRAMIEADAEPDVARNAIFVKIDADALIIRPGFAARARQIFSTRPMAGQIGQVFSNVRGARFANAGWQNYLRKLVGWRGMREFIRGALREKEGVRAGLRAYRSFKAIVSGAQANGYVFGDICIGGCNVARRELIAALGRKVALDNSPFRFLPVLGEDSVMTLHCYWLGFAPVDDSSDGGLFGVEVAKFRVDPFLLKDRGHFVVHSLKYGHRADGRDLSESELVEALLESSPTVPTSES
jgi:hypothetical protein